ALSCPLGLAAPPPERNLPPGEIVGEAPRLADPRNEQVPVPMPPPHYLTHPADPVLLDHGTYGSDTCDTCERGHAIGGFGLLFLKPRFSDNPAFNITTGNLTTTPHEQPFTDFSFDMTASPQFWLGYVGAKGLGGRIGWWHFDQDASQIHVLNDNF